MRGPAASAASWASRKRRTAADLLDGEHARQETVVDVVVVVGDLVHDVHELRFERRRFPRRVFLGDSGVALGVVLGHSLADLPRQVEPRKLGITSLEHLEDAQGLAVVLEAAVASHELVHHALARMTERGVTEIVAQDAGTR